MSSRSSRSHLRGVCVASLLAVASVVGVASAQASTLPTLTLTITKSSITVAGATQSGAVNVVSTATGVKEASAILVLLKPGVSVAELESGFKGGDPNKASKYGSIVFDAEPTPGHPSEAQTSLQPGQYIALSPGKHERPRVQQFTVTAATSPTALPAPQATIRSIEFGFSGPSTLHDGEVVRFENEGFLVHMDIAFPVKSKSAAKQVVHDLLVGKEKGLEKLVVGEPIGFAGPLSHEGFQQETITAKPGWYVQACFMNTQDGREHTRLGMERIIKITK
jgi:uncharacterized cupredoxin-like copper-binding protein